MVQFPARTNPFPGLRPFELDEEHLFFGREGQADELLTRLNRTRFLAVVGTSGSGKSSLVRAGLLPSLYSGFLQDASSGWRVAIMRPGSAPIANLSTALNTPEVFGVDSSNDDATIRTALTESTLRRGALGLLEVTQQARMEPYENLLVVVDQFEELFRFKSQAQGLDRELAAKDEAAAFVKLLLGAVNQRETPIFVVLTMRSDFLGDCAQFRDLPEKLNDSQYLVPRLAREQLKTAIAGPVAVGGATITPRLANRLLNDAGENPDQLPILQHALMRTWDYWENQGTPQAPLDLEHYEAIGSMARALSLHADQIYERLPNDRSRQITETIFRCLTDRGADNREIRRPTQLGEICAAADASLNETITVIEEFRASHRSFLMPPAVINLNINSIIDISHESLMRNWNRLRDWVNEEASSANTFRRLAETAELNNQGKAGFLRDPELTIGLNWKQEQNPNKAWSRRYADNLEEVIIFLEASAASYREEIAAREQDRQREIQNTLLKQEIEERSLVEKALRASESRFRNIFENSTVGIYNTSGDGKFVAVNPSLATIFGYETPEEMIDLITDMRFQFYLEPKRRDELMVYLKRFGKITDAESEVLHKDGHTFWISESIWSVWGEDQSFLYFEGIVQDISERRQMETELRQQRQQADRLLVNILPYRVAQRLKGGARTIAESLDQVSVLFTSLVDFTDAYSQMTPQQLVKMLNEMFSMFDQLAEFHRLEKIKTIGDVYMVAGGLPSPNDDHGEAIAQCALDFCDAIKQFPRPNGQPFQIQVGINTGPVVAGVIGRRKFAYDLWGDTVNIASRMESTSEPQRIQVTSEFYEKLQDKFEFERRDNLVVIKGREPMITYWLTGRK